MAIGGVTERVKERVETWFLVDLQGFVSVFLYLLNHSNTQCSNNAYVWSLEGLTRYKVVRALAVVAWTGGTVGQGGTLGCGVLDAELGSLNFISKAVWMMENL